MDIFFGFITMLILILISAIPIFVAAFIWKKYPRPLTFVFVFIGIFIYCCLKVWCQSLDIIEQGSSHMPILAILILYGIASIFASDSKDIKPEFKKDEEYFNETNSSASKYLLKTIDLYNKKYDCITLNEILSDNKKFIKNNEYVINNNSSYYNSDNSINKKAIEQMFVRTTTKIIDKKLTSGEFHIYRGTLNDEGKKLLHIYKEMLKDFIRLEIVDENTKEPIDENWINANINSLIQDINALG